MQPAEILKKCRRLNRLMSDAQALGEELAKEGVCVQWNRRTKSDPLGQKISITVDFEIDGITKGASR